MHLNFILSTFGCLCNFWFAIEKFTHDLRIPHFVLKSILSPSYRSNFIEIWFWISAMRILPKIHSKSSCGSSDPYLIFLKTDFLKTEYLIQTHKTNLFLEKNTSNPRIRSERNQFFRKISTHPVPVRRRFFHSMLYWYIRNESRKWTSNTLLFSN